MKTTAIGHHLKKAKIRDQIEKGRQNYFKPEIEVSKTNFGAGNKRLNLKFQSDI